MAQFNTANAAAMARRRYSPRRLKPRAQILRMQAQLLADSTSPAVPPHIRAACARAWDVLEERLRIIDGKPLPGQLRPDLEQRRKRPSRKAILAIQPNDLPSASSS